MMDYEKILDALKDAEEGMLKVIHESNGEMIEEAWKIHNQIVTLRSKVHLALYEIYVAESNMRKMSKEGV